MTKDSISDRKIAATRTACKGEMVQVSSFATIPVGSLVICAVLGDLGIISHQPFHVDAMLEKSKGPVKISCREDEHTQT